MGPSAIGPLEDNATALRCRLEQNFGAPADDLLKRPAEGNWLHGCIRGGLLQPRPQSEFVQLQDDNAIALPT
jgi:hypothetical protein